ncbi:MAG TPA: glycosyltransferase [Solirubrobacteraceae bacterium]|nr:glycosyltransferase [Solirubrobacteraceae bacterium]
MKIAVIAEWYPSPADPVHGIWAHRQALAARDAGAEVTVLAMRRPVPPLSLLRGGDLAALRRWGAATRGELAPTLLDGLELVPVPWGAPPRPLSYGTWGWWMAPFLHRALSALRTRWRFDLVHAHNVAPTGQAALAWTRATGVPLVVSAHGPDIIDIPARSRLGRAAVRGTLAGAQLVLANSRWAAARCTALGAPNARVQTLYLGADLPGSAPSPEVVAGAPLRLITIAHLQARKHHATVLTALAALDPPRRPSYEIIGDGEERAHLEALTAQLGLTDRVRFLGQLPHKAALARLAAADLFVMAGVQEPFGVAFVEAMAAGLPAVGGAGEGGPADIAAAGEGMLTVPPGDPGALATLLARLDADRVELARLGAAARATVAEHFTWARCGTATVAAYREVLTTAAAR